MTRSNSQTRHFVFDVAARVAGDDAIPVVLSTDAVVEVSDGPEMLVHSVDAIDLRRAPLPIIAGHQSNQVNVGLIDGLSAVNGKLRGNARFGVRDEAAAYKADVVSGVIRSVSVGYARMRGKMRSDGVLVTDRWMPTHVAMVAQPADIGAGFYRALDAAPAFEIEKEVLPVRVIADGQPAQPANKGASTMPDDNAASAGAIAAQPKQPEAPVTEQPKTAAELEQRRIAAIRGLCKANNVQESVARLWIERNYDFTQVSEEFVKMRQVKDETLQSMPAYLDMPAKEKERYSLLRALRASASNDWSKAGLELEANKQVSKQMNRLPRSDKAFFVPLDIMMRDLKPQRTYITRDMTAAGVSGSQYLVGTDNQPGSFIELLRATSVGLRMGVTRMAGLVGNVTIPKMTAGNTAYWLADETTAITESQPTIGQLPLAPKNVAALTELSHQLMQQSTPDAEQLVLTSIARDIGLAADIGILRGSGSAGQPQGIVGTSGVGSVTGTTISAVGIIEFQSDVATANALMPGSGYVTTPIVAGLLMARPELPSTGTTRMWTGNMMEGNMLGFPAMSSSQMLAGTMLFGNWPSVILAEWGVLEMMTNPYSDFTRGLTAVRGWYTCDVGVRYPAAFSYASTIT